MTSFIDLLYLIASVLFILTLRGLSSPATARRGNLFGMSGMLLVIIAVLISGQVMSLKMILGGVALGGAIGFIMAKRAQMTSLPQLVALFNGFGGFASVFVALAAFHNPVQNFISATESISPGALFGLALSVIIGGVTFTGSLVAFGKLNGNIGNKFLRFPKQQMFNALAGIILILSSLVFIAAPSDFLMMVILAVTLVLGLTLVTPIGGADMPVVISMLNSYSGFAGVAVGFTIQSTLLIIVGSLVGASGAILSYIMCKSMNRSFLNVVFGGGSSAVSGGGFDATDKIAKIGSADDAGFMMKNAQSVIIVPGYGMAVAQAQHAVKEMADLLKAEGVDVKYAIHPVAGRMPGHMNVLLAEANVPYDEVFELDDINREFAQTDVVLVIGANDITNPAAKDDPTSPIFGMPVLDVGNAKTVYFIKRSMGSGYAGVDNPLFFADNTVMLLDGAKKMVENIIKAIKDN